MDTLGGKNIISPKNKICDKGILKKKKKGQSNRIVTI
jgi:hypothetical protein